MPQHALAQICLSTLLASLLITPCGCAPDSPPAEAKAVEAPVPPPPSETAERWLGVQSPTDEDLHNVIAEGKDYQSLSLTTTNSLTESGFLKLSQVPSLRELTIVNNQMALELKNYEALGSIPYLQKLTLRGMPIPREAIPAMSKIKHLNSLFISSKTLDAELVKNIIHSIPQLRKLTIRGGKIDANTGSVFSESNLRELEVFSHIEDSNNFYKYLSKSEKLKSLETGFSISDEDLYEISRITSLESLTTGGKFLTDRGAEHLKNLQNLTHLKIHNEIKLTDKSVASIGTLKKLTKLEIIDSLITDAGLLHLNGLINLRSLTLAGSRTQIDGRSFANLSFPQLEYLNLSNTNFCAKYGHDLKKYSHMKELDLSYVNLSCEHSLEKVSSPEEKEKLTIGTLDQLTQLKELTLSVSMKTLTTLHKRMPTTTINTPEPFVTIPAMSPQMKPSDER